MDRMYFDPGLQQAYIKHTHQRLLDESTQTRISKSVNNEKSDRKEVNLLSIGEKLSVIGQLIRDTGREIISVIRASEYPTQA